MYILPSGPSAAPLGPPGISATTSLRPSGQTRVSRRPRISTSTTEPSGITTGPSGNSRSVARTRTLAMKSSRLVFGCRRIPGSIPHAQHFVASCYGKVDLACQATTPVQSRKAACDCPSPDRRIGEAISIKWTYRWVSQGLNLYYCAQSRPGSRFRGRHCRCAGRISRRSVRIRRIGRLHARGRQPVIPDRVDGAADGRDVLGVGEHRVFLLGHPHARNSRGRSEKSVTSTPAM